MLFDGSVDEGGDVARSSACLVRSLGDCKFAQELIENLDRLCVLGFCGCRVVGDGVHGCD